MQVQTNFKLAADRITVVAQVLPEDTLAVGVAASLRELFLLLAEGNYTGPAEERIHMAITALVRLIFSWDATDELPKEEKALWLWIFSPVRGVLKILQEPEKTEGNERH